MLEVESQIQNSDSKVLPWLQLKNGATYSLSQFGRASKINENAVRFGVV